MMPDHDWHVYDWLLSNPPGHSYDAHLVYRAAMPLEHRPPARTMLESWLDLGSAQGLAGRAIIEAADEFRRSAFGPPLGGIKKVAAMVRRLATGR